MEPEQWRHVTTPTSRDSARRERDSEGRILVSSKAPRKFAYLSWKDLDGRNQQELTKAVPHLYELVLSGSGTGAYELRAIPKGASLGNETWLLQEILPGQLNAYARMIGDYKVVYEQGSSNAQHLTDQQRDRIKEEEATLCRRIAYPQPPPRKGMLGQTLPEGPSQEVGETGGGLVRGAIEEQQKPPSKQDPRMRPLPPLPATTYAGPSGESSRWKGKEPMPSRSETTTPGSISSMELTRKLNAVAEQQDMVASWGNWTGFGKGAADVGEQVPIFDADGTFVCYAPKDEDWNMDFQTREQYSDSDYGPDEGIPDEGLMMRARARDGRGAEYQDLAPKSGRGEKEDAPGSGRRGRPVS